MTIQNTQLLKKWHQLRQRVIFVYLKSYLLCWEFQTVKTDNGSSFQSHRFREFAQKLGFKHRRITPYWPRANGEAERFMQNLNRVIKNAKVNGHSNEQELQLFAYRATPHSVTKIAPNDLLFGFNKTSGLPSSI